MFKSALLGFLLATSIYAQAESCSSFVGKFKISEKGCLSGTPGKMVQDLTYTGFEISYEPSSQNLEMTYHLGSNNFTAAYIADGKEHPGDLKYTGVSYTAFCDEHILATRRIFAELLSPLITTLNLRESDIELVESHEGSEFVRICELVKE